VVHACIQTAADGGLDVTPLHAHLLHLRFIIIPRTCLGDEQHTPHQSINQSINATSVAMNFIVHSCQPFAEIHL
jgi:hypothetical protein